jgi:hypothetical protein
MLHCTATTKASSSAPSPKHHFVRVTRHEKQAFHLSRSIRALLRSRFDLRRRQGLPRVFWPPLRHPFFAFGFHRALFVGSSARANRQ